MQTKRIHESAKIVASADGSFRVCLLSEGIGSSAEFRPEFFTQENADALAGSLSFPGHPQYNDPTTRDPMAAIGQISESVTVERDPETNLIGFWGEYMPASSRPDVGAYLKEFGTKLGLSVFIDSDGQEDPETYRWIPRNFYGDDPYKSVDLVVAAGRGGKFEKVAESLGLLDKTSATAGEKQENPMDIKELGEEIVKLSKTVEGLVATLNDGATANAQVKADADAVAKTVEGFVENYDKAVDLIEKAKLTESQSSELRALAKTGVDITDKVESAKKVLTEALALSGTSDEEFTSRQTAEAHLGHGVTTKDAVKSGFGVAGFGVIS
jgi:hypothetical protein